MLAGGMNLFIICGGGGVGFDKGLLGPKGTVWKLLLDEELGGGPGGPLKGTGDIFAVGG